MQLDIRVPIGLMFGVFGVLLTGFGLASPASLYRRSLGINVNLWWGLALLLFAAIMLALAWRARKGAATLPR